MNAREDMRHADVIVVGAGVIGLAIAAKFSSLGQKVIVLEANNGLGLGISGRGSNVIHSGLYYPENSLKKRFCIDGQSLLYGYCERKDIPHKMCGKLVVATTGDEIEQLRGVASQAARNGVEPLRWLDRDEVREIEPALDVAAALHVPKTGIIDGAGYLKSLRADVENNFGAVLFNHRLSHARREKRGFFLDVRTSDGGTAAFASGKLVFAGGLGAHTLAKCMKGYDLTRLPGPVFVKGSYFRYALSDQPFKHLVYPVPVKGGLGIHLTMTLAGQICFGPDVEWLTGTDEAHIDFSVDTSRQSGFYTAIRRYWAAIPDGALTPDRASVRPQLAHAAKGFADFLIQTSIDHGIEDLVALFGIESPGLTSSLALADHVASSLA
jgi:L-2-hydroxyglutarate oxidase LhgO